MRKIHVKHTKDHTERRARREEAPREGGRRPRGGRRRRAPGRPLRPAAADRRHEGPRRLLGEN